MIKQVSKTTANDRRTTHSRGALSSIRNGKIGKALLIALLGIIAVVILWVGITKSLMQKREERQDIIAENRLHMLNIELYNWLDSLGKFPTRDQVSTDLIEELEQTCVIRWDALPENFRELRVEQEKFREDQIEFPEDYANRGNISLPVGLDSETILVAYEKKTKLEGGYVLFLDGTTEELTPDEFSPFLDAANKRAGQNQAEVEVVLQLRDPENKQYDAIEAIESLGGEVNLSASDLEYSKLKNVKLDNLRTDHIGDEDLIHLSNLPEVQMLDLRSAEITDEGLKHLSRLVNIEKLLLQRTQIQGPGLIHCSEMKALQELNLSDTKIDDDALVHLQPLENLEKLELSSTKISASGLRHLASLPNLKHLNLNFTEVSDEELQELGKMSNLQSLSLNSTKITDAGLAHLKNLNNLQDLDVSFTNISNDSIQHLARLKKLKQLSLFQTKMTRSAAKQLKQSLPDWQITFD